jgi:prephenate dehydrogenase
MTDASTHAPTVLITGLGLMGASLAAAVQSTSWKVLLHHRRPEVAAAAAARGWGTAVTDFAAAAHADLAVICTPVSVLSLIHI